MRQRRGTRETRRVKGATHSEVGRQPRPEETLEIGADVLRSGGREKCETFQQRATRPRKGEVSLLGYAPVGFMWTRGSKQSLLQNQRDVTHQYRYIWKIWDTSGVSGSHLCLAGTHLWVRRPR